MPRGQPYSDLAPLDELAYFAYDLSKREAFGGLSSYGKEELLRLLVKMHRSPKPLEKAEKMLTSETTDVRAALETKRGAMRESTIRDVKELYMVLEDVVDFERWSMRSALAVVYLGLDGTPWRRIGRSITGDSKLWDRARNEIKAMKL